MVFKDGFTADEEQEKKLKDFYSLVIEYNEKVNITAITEEKEFFIKHIWDSIAGEKYFRKGALVAEVGSGGGFPSLPLKIVRGDLKFTLFESVGKKCMFLKEATGKLGLERVSVVNCRAEEAGKNMLYREKFDICCARAVARLNTLLEYCVPLVKPGGIFIAYKGIADAETEEAENAASVLGCRLLSTEKYSLPANAGERSLIVYKKIRSTPSAYPRGLGKERKNPL